jgi:Cell wall-active antibiotics response LiaF, C-terminal
MSKPLQDDRPRPDDLRPPREHPLPAARLAERAGLAAAEDHESIVALFSGAARKGAWEPPERLSVYAIFGGVLLDFRDADLLEGTTEVVILALFGGVEIRVPDDIDVECRGSGVFGGFSHSVQRSGNEGAPLLRISGAAIFGGVEVKTPEQRAAGERRGRPGS